jgi:DNA-directed RNA polymerase subunit M/transcription elongation factor TFIIS
VARPHPAVPASRSEPTSPASGEVNPPSVPRSDPKCPHCHVRDAEVISLFGTQAMTLQYRCRKCGTVFEAIKYD